MVYFTAAGGLFTSTYYDDRGRTLQTIDYNFTGGFDYTTNQYDFSSKLLESYLQHQKGGLNTQTHHVKTKMNYDGAGRLKSVYKNLDYASSDQLIDSMQYNELGQLRTKYLGNNLDSQVYDYNIRGWLTGINKQYVANTSSTPTNYFGMELAYDKSTSVTGTTSFANPLFNGNIAGTVWKSAGDGVARKYDYTYDNVNRLTGAGFHQNTNNANWDSSKIDFSVNKLSYDANGNILTMTQNGFMIGASGVIDNLVYTYQANSNKLLQVYDSANVQTSQLGDFHYNPSTKSATDYAYDGNGNLILDNNKTIGSITYNYLNLPTQIIFQTKGSISYMYDPMGNKLSKTTVDNTVTPAKTTVTKYIKGFVYQQDTLQFMGHEEGRARWAFHKYLNGNTAYGWEYDFFEKDHLGNTRVLLSQEKDSALYVATMDSRNRNTENQLFYNIPTTSYARSSVSGYPNDTTYGSPNDSVTRLNPANGQKVGPAIILKVMSGDMVDLGVQYYYNNITDTNRSSLSASDILLSLATGVATLSGGAHGTFSALNSTSGPLAPAVNSFMGSNGPQLTGKPTAYLNWMLLDNQFNYVASSSGALPVGAAGVQSNGNLQVPLAKTQIPMVKSGYLYIYVSNATPGWDVFFDNLSVKTYSGPLVEEDHYYPFGLTMAGISDKALKTNYAENKFRYNKGSELQNKEFSDGSGLEMYETQLRELDPQLGRWWQVDSKPTEAESPFSSMGNNPILRNDALGDSASKPDILNDPRFTVPAKNRNGDQTGIIRNATEDEYRENPLKAAGKDFVHLLAEFTGLNAVDDASANMMNPNVPVADKILSVVNIGLSTPAEGMAPEGKVHSVYGDGVQVMKGEQPARLGEAKVTEKEAIGFAHSQLRMDKVNGRIYQMREFNAEGKPVRDIDLTSPTYSNGNVRPGHPIPHQHNFVENPSGGSMKRGDAMPIPLEGAF